MEQLLERPSSAAAATATENVGRTQTASSSSVAKKQKSSLSKKKGKPKKAVAEKRQRRFRSKCPAAVQQRIDRAVTQRLYLVQKGAVDDYPSCTFVVLGSTGNVYTVRISHQATCTCPDHAKGNLCKHILFVLLKVIKVPPASPLIYQAAWITSELEEMFSYLSARRVGGLEVLANEKVRSTYAKMQAGHEPAEEEGDEGRVGRRSLEENSDCPICFDSMANQSEPLTYCRAACGTNFHRKCIEMWASQNTGHATCPNCRQPWEESSATQSSPTTSEGYANLGRMQGQSPVRDTSTYYSRWSPPSGGYKRRRYR